jgi:hypothetical protein
VETVLDAQAVVDRAAVLRNSARTNWKGDTHCIASVPMPLWQRLRTEGRLQDGPAMQRWLNEHNKFQIRKVRR